MDGRFSEGGNVCSIRGARYSKKLNCSVRCRRSAWPSIISRCGQLSARRKELLSMRSELPGWSRRYPKWIVAGKVPRLHQDDPEAYARIQRREPVVLVNATLCKNVIGKWDFDFLAKHMARYSKWQVHMTRADGRIFQRVYGKGLREGGIEEMSFDDFAQRSSNDAKSRAYYLQTGFTGKDSGHDELVKHLGFQIFSDAMRDDKDNFDWHWLHSTLRKQGLGSFEMAQLWIGRGNVGSLTPLHFDRKENFFAQVLGTKRMLLVPPDEIFNIYPYPCEHPFDTFSQVDFDNPDLMRFPSFRDTRGYEIELVPGDVLYLPCWWFHHVHAAPGDNISISFWSAPDDALKPPDAIEYLRQQPPRARSLATYRAAEKLAADNLGAHADLGKFWHAIAIGKLSWMTPKMRKVASSVQSLLVKVLGAEGAEHALRGMVRDGRLDPGPNRNGSYLECFGPSTYGKVTSAMEGQLGGYWSDVGEYTLSV
eukprot:gnl/MRDRNA2_/MRDRNA2_26393_c0_seq1.p1 gnl/MRDRNA2_/MRDRNA2_26393_c0~~gnl/MRDRNA2_/MRDRNA2_26393_c0_seq1.p1  ORF type:complete len:480 (-),score=65.32 gnl/MRDRNA2_/MRDRNA2_26393_c0_seq1:33-1472(-)